MNEKPWFEECDPLRKSYGLLTQSELNIFLKMFDLWNNNLKSDDSNSLVEDIKSGIKLVDFSDYYNEFCQFTLFEKLSLTFGNNEDFLYWIPLTDDKELLFEKFDPFMIAKTLINVEALEDIDRSYMRLALLHKHIKD